MIKVVYAASWFARRRFYAFGERLYANDPKWAQPALWSGRTLFSSESNALLKHPHVFLMAVENGCALARIMAGTVNGKGYFAMFDAQNRPDAVRMLVREMREWQKMNGSGNVIGPIAPTEVDIGGGVLTSGFNEAAAYGDAYNAPYYCDLLEMAGLTESDECLVYRVNLCDYEGERYRRGSDWASERYGYEVRTDLVKRPRELVRAICEIMGNETDERTMSRLIGSVHQKLAKEMCPVVFVSGRPVGYILTLRGKMGRARVVTMWVHEKWRRKGVTAVLFHTVAEGMKQLDMCELDASWVHAANQLSRKSIENAGGQVIHRYKRYSLQI